MPRPQHPPTPGSSTELRGKDGSEFNTFQMSFELPPPAASPGSPIMPASEVFRSRRRCSNTARPSSQDSFALPPPPTRSRRIIQMTPQDHTREVTESTSGARRFAAKEPGSLQKKQPSSTSMAGRKIARKTAHSLIERRRRSKMNEEFGVLKDMIPACTGEMHKLAVLQASIDYIKYLEDCVTQLKTDKDRSNPTSALKQISLPPSPSDQYQNLRQHKRVVDHEAENSILPTASNTVIAQKISGKHLHHSSISPALTAQNFDRLHSSFSSPSFDPQYDSQGTSSNNSPMLSAGEHEQAGPTMSLASPRLPSTQNSDQEATAALLMLNCDRRGPSRGDGWRGLSVKDLLST